MQLKWHVISILIKLPIILPSTLEENLFQSTRLGWRFTFQRENKPNNYTVKAALKCVDLSLIETLQRDKNIAMTQQSPSNLTELEQSSKKNSKTIRMQMCKANCDISQKTCSLGLTIKHAASNVKDIV